MAVVLEQVEDALTAGTPTGLADRAVFVRGFRKSGTTLLQSLLDGHPQLLVDAAESKFMPRWWPQAELSNADRRVQLGIAVMLREFGSASTNGQYLDQVDRDAVLASFRRRLESRAHLHPRDYLVAAIFAYGEVTGQLHDDLNYWVEKNPEVRDSFAELRRWWPRARVIRIVRDPRANYAALHRLNPDLSPDAFAAEWVRYVRSVAASRVDRNQLRLRFEDLTSNVDMAASNIALFLSIDDHEILRRPTKVGGSVLYRGNSSAGKRYAAVSTEPTERWRSELSQQAIQMIEAVAGREMSEHGYDRTEGRSARDLALRGRALARRARSGMASRVRRVQAQTFQ